MPADRVGHVFVTGCYRSGTTLTEKLLHQVPHWCVASQPAPVLYFLAKQRFLDDRSLQRRYPLDHLFGERDYRRAEFDEFVANFVLDRAALDAFFDDLADYEVGLWTPETLELRNRIEPGSFFDVQRQIHLGLADALADDDPAVVGGKEILCEEFVPALLEAGHRVVVAIRDPRDMIASLDFSERDNLTGAHRPLLYSLRSWRKSVATAIAHRDHPSFTWLRMEDLVDAPAAIVSSIVGETVEVGADGIVGQDGQPWASNSSFGDTSGVDRSTTGRFRQLLSDEIVRYIEALTAPEMTWLGYERATEAVAHETELSAFVEYAPVHAKFPADYSTEPSRLHDEVARWRFTSDPDSAVDDEERWFVHDGVLDELRAALATV